jgi:hypothetical protein
MSVIRGEIRFSSILVDEGEGLRVYRSFDEVPSPIRRRIVHAIEHGDSGTVLIADRRGPDRVEPASAAEEGVHKPRWNRRTVFELVVAGALALGVWILATLR